MPHVWISDRGFSLILPAAVKVDLLATGFWLPKLDDEPRFFLASARHHVSIGGGFWALGVEVDSIQPRDKAWQS
jgi:hypothetical protein